MTLRALINAFISLLWIAFLLSVFMAVSWWRHAPWLDSLDSALKDRYLYEPQRRYGSLVETYGRNGDHQQAQEALIELLEDLARVQKNDVLDSTRRVAFNQLVRVYRRMNDLDSALAWTQKWLAFDARDINGLIQQGSLMMLNPGTYAEGRKLLDDLAHRFPESLSVANGRATALASLGRVGEAFMDYRPFLKADMALGQGGNSLITPIGDLLTRAWEVLVIKDGERYRKSLMFHWEFNEQISGFRLDAVGPVDELHLVFPAQMILDISILGISMGGAPLEVDPLTPGMIAIGENRFRKYEGSSGFIILKNFDARAPLAIDLQVRVAPPETLQRLFSKGIDQLVIDQLASANYPDAVLLFRQVRDAWR